ncbi:MAG TPA: sigma-70 family RNA polymerase sigma factor [Thermoguttaceae bacterium]|nr:sigma-70 family RNA polymerase sigma factor [Thermoguttaceae bacterium]
MFTTQDYATEPTTDCAAIVQAAQDGDREAFDRLVDRFESTVYAICLRRLRNRADAQELCQEVFMQVLRKLDQLQDPRCFAGWLRAIAVRMAINRAVRRKPVTTIEPAVAAADCVEFETPLGAVLARERRNQVHKGLGRLGRMDRETLEAFYFRGQSLVEMSDAFQSPVGTIKRRLHVARKRLAAELAELAPA